MPGQQIVDLFRTRLLPRLECNSFQIQPSPSLAVARSENYFPVPPYTAHSHPFFEWVWCIENHAFLRVQDQIYRLEAGDFCLLPPGQLHADVYLPSLNPYQVLWCSYQKEAVDAHHCIYTPVNPCHYAANMFAAAPPFTASLLGGLQQEFLGKQAHREPVCRALVSTLAHLMLRAFEDSLQHQEQKHFYGKISVRVDEFIYQHFSEPITLDHVARALKLSRNYLATLYKQETGKTIGQRLTEIRLGHAKKLLLETHLPVQAVAKAAGYDTPEHFSRVFRKHEGVAPRLYGK